MNTGNITTGETPLHAYRQNHSEKPLIPELKLVQLSHGVLSYREAGEGKPIVFFHGMNGNSKSWAYQFAGLSNRYRIIAWDAPGFGFSDVCEASPDGYEKAGLEFLAAIHVEDAILVGHSMGGIVATRVAAARNSPVSKLVLSCTHWGYGRTTAEDLMPRYSKRIEEMKQLGKEEYGRIRASKMLPKGTEETNPEVFRFIADVSCEGRIDGLVSAGKMIQTADNRRLFNEILKPILIVYGEKDPVIDRSKTEELAAGIPAARTVMIPGAGHAPYAENSKLYNEIIAEFASE